eukprot:4321252-Amphidinium_carterae.1
MRGMLVGVRYIDEKFQHFFLEVLSPVTYCMERCLLHLMYKLHSLVRLQRPLLRKHSRISTSEYHNRSSYFFAKIISNEKYDTLDDVEDKHVDTIAAELKRRGWQGAERVKRNQSAEEMEHDIEQDVLQFIRGCPREATVTVLFWFSGHGCTFFGTEFLHGVDASCFRPGVPWVKIQKMLEGVQERPVRIIALLSACRSPDTMAKGLLWQWCRWACCVRCARRRFARPPDARRFARPSDPGSLIAWACSEGGAAAPGAMSKVFAEELVGGEHLLKRILDRVRREAPKQAMQMGGEPQALDLQHNFYIDDFSLDASFPSWHIMD